MQVLFLLAIILKKKKWNHYIFALKELKVLASHSSPFGPLPFGSTSGDQGEKQ